MASFRLAASSQCIQIVLNRSLDGVISLGCLVSLDLNIVLRHQLLCKHEAQELIMLNGYGMEFLFITLVL